MRSGTLLRYKSTKIIVDEAISREFHDKSHLHKNKSNYGCTIENSKIVLDTNTKLVHQKEFFNKLKVFFTALDLQNTSNFASR